MFIFCVLCSDFLLPFSFHLIPTTLMQWIILHISQSSLRFALFFCFGFKFFSSYKKIKFCPCRCVSETMRRLCFHFLFFDFKQKSLSNKTLSIWLISTFFTLMFVILFFFALNHLQLCLFQLNVLSKCICKLFFTSIYLIFIIYFKMDSLPGFNCIPIDRLDSSIPGQLVLEHVQFEGFANLNSLAWV